MNNKNLISYFAGKRKVFGLLCAFLFCVSCTNLPKINETARQEAETLAKEATALYEKSQQPVSFQNKYTWMSAISMDDAKTRSGKFLSVAKGLESAKDKFLQASAKMTEALNGQTRFDSDDAKKLQGKSQIYKMWAEMADFESKSLQDASAVTDKKALEQKMTEAQEKRDKMNKELMEYIRVRG